MSTNNKIILIAIAAILFGLGLGYLIFKPKNNPAVAEQPMQHEALHIADETTWTCSMHPQIRRDEPGLCPICEMDLIPAETTQSANPLVLEMTEDAIEMMNIETTIIGASNETTEQSLRLSGKVQEDERRASSQVAHVPGRIEQLMVTFTGESVKEGQILARLYSPELITAQQELLEAKKLVDLNPALLEAARNKLRYWKIGESLIQRIETEEKIQETFPLYASASGVVTNKRVNVGDYVQQGAPLFDLVNLSRVWVLFDVYEKDLAGIRIGDQLKFSTPALPRKTFTSRITFIDPLIDPLTRVATLRTEVSNPGGLLKPEMFVTGILQKKSSRNASLSVPKSAVLWTGKRSVVYVKQVDQEIPSFEFREVELGEALGDHYQVTSGLEAGEEVVTQGNFTIDAAAQLNNQKSMMNQNVQVKNTTPEAIPDFREETPPAFKEQLRSVVDAYLNLKDALVATDAAATSTASIQVLDELRETDMSLLKGPAHMYWMERLRAIEEHGQLIQSATDIEKQRVQFSFLSEALINTLNAFGLSGDTIYVQHCPMAMEDRGANWLSSESAIRNPYFGEKMMKCGLVKQVVGEK